MTKAEAIEIAMEFLPSRGLEWRGLLKSRTIRKYVLFGPRRFILVVRTDKKPAVVTVSEKEGRVTHFGCKCELLGKGAQPFRIRSLDRFREVADLGPDYPNYLESRKVWQCRICGQFFALVTIPIKGGDDRLVCGPGPDWRKWDWKEIGEIAETVGWHGPGVDKRYLF